MKVTLKGNLFAQYSLHNHRVYFSWYPFDSWEGSVKVKPLEIITEVPDNYDPRVEQAEQLREQIKKIKAEAYQKTEDLRDQIGKLLALSGPAPALATADDDDTIPF